MTKQWVVSTNDRNYRIELEHNTWTNAQQVSINSQVVFRSPTKLNMVGVICFTIEGKQCAILITNKLLGFSYDLIVDEVSTTTHKKVKYTAMPPVAVLVNEGKQ